MSFAIHYTSIKPSSANDREVFGIQIAVENLLKALMRHARQEKIPFLIASNNEKSELEALVAQTGIDKSRIVLLDRRFPEKNLVHFSTVFRAEPDTRNLLWQRQTGANFAFCSLAHAISGAEAGEVLQEYCLSPSRNTDAIICPSHAVKKAIQTFWDSYGNYLGKRFGTTFRCPVDLPVIPLGIDTDAFATKSSPDKRADQRASLGVDETETVLLWVGRLSAAIKAHPLAMFQAAEHAARLTNAKIRLVMVGYFVPAETQAAFQKLAADVCSKCEVSFIAANDPRFPDGLWAAADIFLSLIDNMQESFGLTPVEAMGAGLPRVISDWDGYRDSVTDGEDGFLIQTTQPPPGNGLDLTLQVLSGKELYGGFLAKTALTVFVDAEQAGNRIAQLVANADLRHTMAEKARLRAKNVYDWKNIICAYETLWHELAGGRQNDWDETENAARYTSALPQLPDPYTMYAAYPTTCLQDDDRLSLALPIESIQMLMSYPINTYAHDVLASPEDTASLLGWIAKNHGASISSAFLEFPGTSKPHLWRTLAWLQKLGAIKIHLANRSSPCRI